VIDYKRNLSIEVARLEDGKIYLDDKNMIVESVKTNELDEGELNIKFGSEYSDDDFIPERTVEVSEDNIKETIKTLIKDERKKISDIIVSEEIFDTIFLSNRRFFKSSLSYNIFVDLEYFDYSILVR
jgi:hypothetical protein